MVRYALIDDELSEDEGFSRAAASGGESLSGIGKTPRQSKSILRRKAAPNVEASRVRFDKSMDECSDRMDVEMSEAEIKKAVDTQAAEAFAEIFALVGENKSSMSPDLGQRATKSDKCHIVEEDVVDSEVTPTIFVPPTASLIAGMNRTSIVAKLVSKRRSLTRSSIDAGLRSGKLFRVGFHPSGKTLVPSKEGIIASCKPVFGESKSLALELFQVLVSSCRKNAEYGECSILQVPLALQNGGDEHSHSVLLDCLERMASIMSGNEEARQAFKLLATLLEAPETSSSVFVVGDQSQQSYTFNERRNQALLQWLVGVNTSSVDKEMQAAMQQNNVASAIFAAVSGGDLDKAAKLAVDAGLLDLAITLSTDMGGCAQLATMVDRAVNSGDAASIPRDLLRCVRAVSGDDAMEESLHRLGTRLAWTHRLALKLLQNPSIDLQALIANYDELVNSGRAPFPSPSYSGSGSKAESVQYRILRAIADPGSLSISEVVRTSGFSDNPHDVSYSFLLATTLVASGYVDCDDLKLETISDGFAAQLFAQGAWEWGVATCLCFPGETTLSTALAKMKRAHDCVLKFYGHGDESRRTMLVDTLGIPSAWCSEALAYKSLNVLGYFDHMNNTSPEEATDALDRYWLPNVFFKTKGMPVIKGVVGDAPDSLAAAVYRLQKIDIEVQSLCSKSKKIAMESVPNLANECRALREVFEEAIAEDKKQDDFHSFADTGRVDLKYMLCEAIRLVTKLDFQLVSLSTA